MGTNENAKKFWLNIKKAPFHCKHAQTLVQVAQGRCGASILGDIQSPTSPSPKQPALSWGRTGEPEVPAHLSDPTELPIPLNPASRGNTGTNSITTGQVIARISLPLSIRLSPLFSRAGGEKPKQEENSTRVK